jgi:hypothetical protein
MPRAWPVAIEQAGPTARFMIGPPETHAEMLALLAAIDVSGQVSRPLPAPRR